MIENLITQLKIKKVADIPIWTYLHQTALEGGAMAAWS